VAQKQLRNNKGGQAKLWRSHIKAFQKSGLTRAEYCRRQQLSYDTMTYWGKKLSSRKEMLPKLVQIPVAPNSPLMLRPSEAALKLHISDKFTVEVADHFLPATLSRLLSALEVL
jgi:hypothetical protein